MYSMLANLSALVCISICGASLYCNGGTLNPSCFIVIWDDSSLRNGQIIWKEGDRNASVRVYCVIAVCAKHNVGLQERNWLVVVALILKIILIDWMMYAWIKENELRNTKIKHYISQGKKRCPGIISI